MEDRKMNNRNEVWIVLLVLLLVFLFAGPFMFMGGMHMGPGMMGSGMMGYGYGFNWFGTLIQIFFFLVFIGLIVFGVYYLVSGRSPRANSKALEILRERYAKGEITKEEYDRIKRELS
jgi:putative membrane protein